MIDTVVVGSLIQITDACPAQWEGQTVSGKPVYIRYRFGCLRMDISGKEVASMSFGDSMDGMMSTETMLKLLSLS